MLVLEETSIKLPVKCQQRFMPRRLWPYVVCVKLIWALCSLCKTDLINAKFNCNTIHINMGQHLLKMLHLVY